MKIPAKENISGTLSTQGISPEMAGTQGKIMQAAGEGLASLTEKWQELRDKDETMRSTLELQKRLDEININAMQDPDIWNAGDKAKKEIDKALSETSMMISSGRAREQYLFSAGLDTQRATTAITTSLMKKQIDAGKANTLQVIDGLKKQSYLSGPQEQSVITDKINKTIDDAVNIGYFDREAGYKYKEAVFEEMREGQVISDISISPENALKELKKGTEGAYPDLTPKERTTYVDKAEERIKKIEKEGQLALATAQNQTEASLVDKYFSNQLTDTEVMDLHSQRMISDSFAKSMVNAINSPKSLTKTSDKSTFNKIVETMLDPDKEQKEIEQLMLSKNAIGELSLEDMQTLSLFNRNATKEMIDKKISTYKPKSFLQAISLWSDEYGTSGERDKVKAEMLKEYIGKVNNGENIETALNDIIKNRITKDVVSAVAKPIKKSPAVESKIAELKKQGWSNEKITEALKEKNINPSNYGL